MHQCTISPEAAWELLKKYNKEPFHLRHGLTVAGALRWFAMDLGYQAEADFWWTCGLLHDIDYEIYPDQHCRKAPELLREAGAAEDLIHAVCSHGYGHCSQVEPVEEMEKVLFAIDELTGLIGAVALMHPSKSVRDLKVSSVRKKYKDKKFAAGCSREIISEGARRLGWEIGDLTGKTIEAMKADEAAINEKLAAL